MVFMLENGETIIFKHRAKLLDVSGELLMTTFRLAWTPSIPLEANDFQSPWSNIKGMQFSPPTDTRVCTKVDTLVGAGSAKGIVFFLEGTDKEKELLRLKAEFKKIRSSTGGGGVGGGAAPHPLPSASNSKKRSAAHMPHDDSADAALREARLKQRKAELLAADQHLAKSYRELVEQSKILSAEEFWSGQVNPTLLEDKESQVQRQGRLSIAEIVRNCIKQNADGTASISINKDDRQSIMDSDSTCRRAYAELVPLQKSENEFWTLYLEKYYSGVTPQTEELFSRFQSGVGGAVVGGYPEKTFRESAQRSKNQLESNTDLGFNLLANYSDFRTSENLATEDVLHELKKDVMQLNNESQRVMAPLRREVATGVTHSSHKMRERETAEEEYSSELLSEKVPPYIPLSVAHLRYGEDPDTEKADSGKNTAAVKVSAFGKASGGIARGGAKRPRYEPKSALDIEFGLWGAFPSSERANALLLQDRVALRAAAAAAHQNAGLQGLGTSSLCSAARFVAAAAAAAASPVLGATTTDTTTTTRYEDFRQEMLEAFVEVSELMRHFFSILVREGAEAPKPGTDGAVKVGKLIDRLLARKEQLTAKSRGIRETKRFAEVELEASTAIINDMVKQIGRASSWWTEYCAR